MERFKVTVEVAVEARDFAAAATLVQKAIGDENRVCIDTRQPERLEVESLNVEKPKPRK